MPQEFLLSSYQRMLETALGSGYRFVSYGEIGTEKAPFTCLLRHDIDSEIFSVGPMMEIENAIGVSATYFLMTRSTAYNPFCLEASRTVGRLLENGHRIGLHFMGEQCETDGVEVLVEKIHHEADWLEREFGTTIQAVSFHQPSQLILDTKIEVPGLVNTYNEDQMGGYFYVSDTNMLWRHEHPEEIFRKRLYRRLQLLLHPIWWTERPVDVMAKWRAVLDVNRRTIIAHWLLRERTLEDIDPEDLST